MRLENLFKGVRDKKTLLLILAGAAGILILFLSEFTGAKKEKTPAVSTDSFDAAAYTESAERRLTALLGEIRGVGNVRVMITLDGSGERRFAEDVQSSDETEGERVSSSRQSKTVLAGDGGLPVAQSEPVIRGVAVVCEGAGSESVRREVTETVRAALGIGRDQVYVAQMQISS